MSGSGSAIDMSGSEPDASGAQAPAEREEGRDVTLEVPVHDEVTTVPDAHETVFDVLSLANTLASKSQIGGTSPERVSSALAAARRSLES